MKRKKNIWEGLIIGIFIFLVIVPILTILVWVGNREMGMAVTYPAENFDESGEWNTEKSGSSLCDFVCPVLFISGFGRVPVGCNLEQ